MPDDIGRLQALLDAFARERDWEQFHTPKNLTMALAVEAAELLELYQWLTPGASAETADIDLGRRTGEEMADVFIYLLRLASVLGVDLVAATEAKIEANRRRYTIERSRGSAQKQL